MRIALFVPCFVNDFYPDAALAALEILERQGIDVEYPRKQSCCGQPFINNKMMSEAAGFAARFVDMFADYDYVVSPSSSCIGTVKYRYEGLVDDDSYLAIKDKVFELCEFLHDIIGVDKLNIDTSYIPLKRIGLHNSCHSLRELGLASASELNIEPYSKVKAVLSIVKGLEIIDASRDECCGFGGTFSVSESDVSAMMGRDRVADHLSNGVDIVAGVDMSCLMHMDGLAKRDGTPMRFVHVSQVLAGRL
jgi:L-lactate dehydrogenase complex protein LldE